MMMSPPSLEQGGKVAEVKSSCFFERVLEEGETLNLDIAKCQIYSRHRSFGGGPGGQKFQCQRDHESKVWSCYDPLASSYDIATRI